MAEFLPDPPPLVLPVAPDVLSPNLPLNPPMVGTADPWIHVDGQNRDLILESIRTWVRVSLLPWTTLWQTQLTDWESEAAAQLNAWMELADAYITEYAVAGLSFRTTETPIAGAGTTNVVLVVTDAARPVVVGDLVLDSEADGNYGIVTAVIDATHATVNYVGTLRGPIGLSWRSTATDIAGAGTTNVVLTPGFALGDLVLTTNADGNYGIITAVIDATHATVTYLGTLLGPVGPAGPSGVVQAVVAGSGVTVDDTDPTHPIVSSSGGSIHQTWYYTDPATMNAAVPGGSGTPQNGDIGVLDGIAEMPTYITDIVWVMQNGKWSNPHFTFLGNIPATLSGATGATPGSWDPVTTWLNLGTNTNLSMAGATGVESVGGSHPTYHPDLYPETGSGGWMADKSYYRHGTLNASIIAPGGSVVQTVANVYELTNCTVFEADFAVPIAPLDECSKFVVSISGDVAENALIRFAICSTDAPAAFSGDVHYGQYGRTLQFNGSDLAYDTDSVGPIGSLPYWDIAVDTTGSPTHLEADIILEDVGQSSAPIHGHVLSRYSDGAAFGHVFTSEIELIYSHQFGIGFFNGVAFNFLSPFTGTITVKAA